ncbi:hypothetical protein SAY87_032401 [Trapa incisa]|uniref:Small ribosomal subunit protein uS3 C-terminal domain-containing protein n=1 Tax=Trapa incisa TaxID=236973 RepID=A0AAN7J8F1_9MYRT|nr:hypothetical protein SAY87_032401 [Trapa incisa]
MAPGVAEPSTMGGANAQGRSNELRIRSRIAFFVESSTSEKKCLAEAKKRLTHFIRQENDLRFAGRTKTTISLFPFFGATFFFTRDGVGVYKNLFFEDAREQLLGKLRIKCRNLMGKDKVMEFIEKFIDLGGIGELRKGIEMMIEIILRNKRIPYGQIVKNIPLVMKKGVEGIRICCSGRSEGAEIARTECGKYGKTSRNVFNQKIDYAPAEVSTRYGILGVKVLKKTFHVIPMKGPKLSPEIGLLVDSELTYLGSNVAFKGEARPSKGGGEESGISGLLSPYFLEDFAISVECSGIRKQSLERKHFRA